MEKPFVVCHMLTSLDGKIDGKYMSAPACSPALEKYGEIRGFYGCEATLYGTTTMLGSYSAGRAPAKLPDSPVAPWKITWQNRTCKTTLFLLTRQVNPQYLAYLQPFDISYVFAGKEYLDCALLLHKRKTLFGIEKLMVAGGGLWLRYTPHK